MYYILRNDVILHKSLNEFYLSFINDNQKCIIQINGSGFEILSLCTGKYTENDIVSILERKYPNDDISHMVIDFLEMFRKNSLICLKKEKTYDNIKFVGSNDYYCPSFIILELTNNCPLNCRHCYLGEKKNEYIEKKDLTNIMEQIVNLGVSFVQLTGGEIATYPYLEYAIEYLTSHFIQVNVSTSGIDCSDKMVEIIKKIKKTGGFVRVSLDGLRKTHNDIRQNKKSYDNAISFLTKVISIGIPAQVATCVINQTKEELFKLTKIVKNAGVQRQIFELVYAQGNAKNNCIDTGYNQEEFMNILEQLASHFGDENFEISTELNDHNQNCGAGYKMYKISYDLNVTPCVTMEYSLGNLGNEKLYQIIKRNYHKFKDLKTPCKNVCGACDMLDKCNKCVSKAMQYKSSVERCIWFEQQSAIK